MPRLVIANIDYLVTVDPSRRIIRDGALVIQDGRIVAVGKSSEFPSNPGDDVIDGRGKLALPGVFDTHVHNSQQLGRSCGDEAYSGPERLFRRLWPVEAHMDKGDALCAARLAQLEMIRAGTTCFADPGSYFSAETAQAVKESGMRGMIARTVFDMGQTTMGDLPKGFFEPTDEALVRADEMVAEFEGALDGRLKAWFSIRVPVAMSDDLLRRLGKLAEKRGVEPRRLSATLRGELDWIVMRCLEKDPSRRYQAANNLAEDVRRYLDDLPVEARSPGSVYRVRKFARRHRTAVAAGSGIVVALVIGVALLSWLFVRERDARQRATAAVSTLVGGLMLARAVDDEALSDEILRDVRAAVKAS